MAEAVKRKRTYNASLRQEQAQMTRRRILEGARRLLATGTYTNVTMEGIAKEAGVAYQTVYSVFGTKLQLAKAMVEAGFHFEGVEELAARGRASSDPEVWLRTSAQITRRINETCGDLVRFMRESGDAELLARYHYNEDVRLSQEREFAEALHASARIQPGLSQSDVLDVLWSMTGSDYYSLLVFQRGWTPSRYEEWLGAALIRLLLVPEEGSEPTTA